MDDRQLAFLDAAPPAEKRGRKATRWEPDLRHVRIEDLPTAYRAMAQAVGLEVATALVETWGGRKLTVPPSARPGSPLRNRLGDASERFCAEYAGARIHVPTAREVCRGARDRAIRAAYAAGATVPALMRRFGLGERTVQIIVAGE